MNEKPKEVRPDAVNEKIMMTVAIAGGI